MNITQIENIQDPILLADAVINLEKQIRSSLPTNHYELLYNDGTIINLPRFDNDVPKN